jgi:hypothetical protein
MRSAGRAAFVAVVMVLGGACSSAHSSRPSPPNGIAIARVDVATSRVNFSIDIPRTWTRHDIPPEATTTAMVFAAESPDGPLLNVYAGAVTPPVAPMSDAVKRFEDGARGRGARDLQRSTTTIDGSAAFRVSFTQPVPGGPLVSPVVVYLTRHDQTAYEIQFFGPGKLDSKLSDFIARSLRFR